MVEDACVLQWHWFWCLMHVELENTPNRCSGATGGSENIAPYPTNATSGPCLPHTSQLEIEKTTRYKDLAKYASPLLSACRTIRPNANQVRKA